MVDAFEVLARFNTTLANITLLYIVLNTGLGFALGLYGRVLFYLWMFLSVFLIAFLVGVSVGADPAVAAIFGAGLGFLSLFLYVLGMFLIGAAVGVTAAVLLIDTNTLMLLGFAFGAGMLAVLLNEFFIIIVSSLSGALLVTNATFAAVSLFTGNATGMVTSSSFIQYVLELALTYENPNFVLAISAIYLYKIAALTIAFVVFQLFKRKKTTTNNSSSNNKAAELKVNIASSIENYPMLRKAVYTVIPRLDPDYSRKQEEKHQAEAAKRDAEWKSLKASYKDAFSNLTKHKK